MSYKKSRLCVLVMLYSFCILCFRSTTIQTPIIVHGYIDRMNPAVILIESHQEQLIVADDEMPFGSKEGMWVDVAVHYQSYQVLAINPHKTNKEQIKVNLLQRKLQKQSY